MKLVTSRFGELEIDESRVITFPDGILGFPQYRKYVLVDKDSRKPLKWLQSVENGELAFVIADPSQLVADYTVEVAPEDIAPLELSSPEKAIVLCLVTIGKGGSSITANLVGPIIINPDNMIARQVILNNNLYSVKHDIMASAGRRTAES